jgi:hypothetical protein
MLGTKEAARRAGGGAVLSSQVCLTTPAVVSRKTASMFGWFRTTSILTNPSGVPIVSFSSCLPTEAAFSIPKICPPALCTTWANLLSASARLVMSSSLPIRVENRKGPPCLHGRRHFIDGHRRPPAAPWLQPSTGNLLGQIFPESARGRPLAAASAARENHCSSRVRDSQMRPSALPSSRGTLCSPARRRIQEICSSQNP